MKHSPMKIVTQIIGLGVGFAGLNYFYSYLFLHKLLEENNVAFAPVITMDDVTFSLGMINFQIIFLSLIGFVFIFFWFLIVDNEDEFLKKKGKEITKSLDMFKKKPWFLVFILIMSLCGFVFYFKIIVSSSSMMIYYLIIAIIIPFIYIVFKSKRNLIYWGYIILIIMWGPVFIKDVFNNIEDSDTRPQIGFKYRGNRYVQTSQSYILIYYGYNYIVMRRKGSKGCDLYPLNDVSDISYADK